MPPVVVAAVIGAAASVGTAMYSQKKQKEMQKKQEEEQQRLANEQRDREKELRRAAKPGEEAVEKVDFGSGDTELGSVSEFLVPKFDDTTGIGSEATGGLTSDTSNPLGFSGV